MIRGDTIAAISSSVGPAARMILRLSGAAAMDVAATVGVASDRAPASASRSVLTFDGFTFPTWVYVFRGPHSYTGDDLIELHIPGNPLLAARLLNQLLKNGARAAEPGEFTARAFLNGRMDLSTAEGVAAVISAGNQNELEAGRKLMAGELAKRLKPIMASLTQTLALIEVGIDFSQEDVTVLTAEDQASHIITVDQQLQSLLHESTRFARITHEPRVVLVGRPNAGKSTLLNALAGHDRAVVSPIAGTTRDALSAKVALSRGYILLTDVAGVEETDSTNTIDRQMQSNAQRTLEEADVVVLLKEAGDNRSTLVLSREPDIVVISKIDLIPANASDGISPSTGTPGEGWGGGLQPANIPGESPLPNPPPEYRWRGNLGVSVHNGSGIKDLINALDARCFGDAETTGGIALNVRHIRSIDQARTALARAATAFDGELAAADLREALDALGTVLGQVTPDDVLGEIFSGFCIGK